METPVKTVYRFGPFEANVVSGELLKQGKRVRLQEQPFRLLIILLENAGEVIPKAEIQQRIWKGNTFVDFDGSLRVAIRKLREALGDDAGSPNYIESIPKRGYRFLGPVVVEGNSIQIESLPEAPPAVASSPRKVNWPFGWVLATAIFLLIAVAAVAYLSLSHRKSPLSEKDSVVLADFENKTGDAVFDDTLRQGLAVQMEQSPFLSLVSEDRIQQIVQMMGKPADTRLAPSIAREICQRTGSVAVLDGSIAQIGSQYLLTLRVVNCSNGESMASAESQASDKNHVIEALGKAASEIRKKLGESLSTVQRLDTPLEQATTPSLDALKAFSQGWRVMNTTGEAEAIPFFKHAVELDPDFALAYAYLGIAHTTIGEPGIGADYTRKAYELRQRTSEPENYFISATYFKEVTGNLKTAEQTCALWSQAYPRSEKSHVYLSGAIYPQTGEYEKAAEEGREALRLNPDSSISYSFLMFGDIALNRFEDANATYQEALRHHLSNPLIHQGLYQIAFVQNNPAEMDGQVAWSSGRVGTEDVLLNLKAETAAYSGHLREAREISRQAADSAERSGKTEAAAGYIMQSALREALFGNADEARRRAMSALGLSSNRDVLYGAALALAYASDDDHVRLLIGDLVKRFPEDTMVQFNYLPTLRAKLAQNRGNVSDAIAVLKSTTPYELGGTAASSYGWNALYPVFVRGEAYLDAGKGAEAAAEFQKIIDRSGIVVNEPIGALAHLGLARAYVLQGDMGKASAAYQGLLNLWKDADPGLLLLKRTRTEYEKLPRSQSR